MSISISLMTAYRTENSILMLSATERSPITLFKCRADTGMSFSQWRQQAQLVHAMEMLARGVSVTDVAYTLGYATPSNFIAMFRLAFGDSPARYFAKR